MVYPSVGKEFSLVAPLLPARSKMADCPPPYTKARRTVVDLLRACVVPRGCLSYGICVKSYCKVSDKMVNVKQFSLCSNIILLILCDLLHRNFARLSQLIDETSEEDMSTTPEKSDGVGQAAPPPYPPMDYGLNPAGLQHNPHVPQPAYSPMMMAPPPPAAPQQTVVMVGSNALPPGVCTVCRVSCDAKSSSSAILI